MLGRVSASTSVHREFRMRHLIRTALVTAALVVTTVLTAGPALAAPSDQDATWLRAAHQGNLAEIAAGNAAQQSATTADVRNLGAMFVQMHTDLDNQLKPVAQQLGVALPGGPTAQQQQQLAAVQGQRGQQFDTAWIAQQIAAHSTTLSATQKEVQAGSDQRVLQLARAATPVVQQHLSELRNAAQKYGGPRSVPAGTGGQAADGSFRTAGWGVAGVGALMLVAAVAMSARRRATRR
jgi:putative membrane protein